jgi:glycosyltransferase involved in cell wall biosynthesis
VSECEGRDIDVIVVLDNNSCGVVDDLLLETLEGCGAKLCVGSFGNPGDARNCGLPFARNEWVMFWDSDDKPNIDNIEKAIKDVSIDTDLIIGRYSVFNLKAKNKEMLLDQDTLVVNEKQIPWFPGIWRMIFRKNLIQNLSFPSLKLGEDQVFICKTLLRHPRIHYVQESLYTYTKKSPHQITEESSNLEKASNQLRALDTLENSGYVLHESCSTCEVVRKIEWKLCIGVIARLRFIGLMFLENPSREKVLVIKKLWILGITRQWKYACELHEERKREKRR